MRYKIVPEPGGIDLLRDARAALPLVPGSVEDCCTRIRDRTDLAGRDAARECLTFLQALGLAAETDRGYHRATEDVTDDELAERFRENVFGAREVLAALEAEGPLTVEEAFDALRDRVPRWERDRETDWVAEWRDRTERLLAWAVTFGFAERVDSGYRRAGQG